MLHAIFNDVPQRMLAAIKREEADFKYCFLAFFDKKCFSWLKNLIFSYATNISMYSRVIDSLVACFYLLLVCLCLEKQKYDMQYIIFLIFK